MPRALILRLLAVLSLGFCLALWNSAAFAQAPLARPKPPTLVQPRDFADPSVAGDGFDPAAFARAGFRHAKAEVAPGVRLHYVVGGPEGGPVVLLLHGWPTTWYEWRRVMPLLAARGYHVLAPDLRGLGESDRPAAGYDKATPAEDVFTLGRGLGVERAFVLGHDWGCSTAFALAHLHPEFVRRVIFTENVVPGLGIPGEADWDTLNSRWWHHAFHATPDLPESLIAGRERTYLGYLYAHWAFNPDFLDEFTRAYAAPGALRAGFAYYRALGEDARRNQEFAKTKLPMPALVITAKYQVNEILNKQLQPVLADYRGLIFDRCAHFLSIECPQEEAAQADAFFREGENR